MKTFNLFQNQVPYRLRITSQLYWLLSHLSLCRHFSQTKLTELKTNFLVTQDHAPALEIETVLSLSPSDFKRKYINRGQPLLFKKTAQSWPSHTKWDFDFFIKNYGEQVYRFQNYEGLNAANSSESQSLQDYLHHISESKNYLNFCPILEINPELTQDLNQNWLRSMRKCFLGISYQTFLGPKSVKTKLHSDTTSFFYIQIRGRKKWTLISPSALLLVKPEVSQFEYSYSNLSHLDPSWEKINKYEFVMDEGDILYVPSWMWHEVENLDDSIGISYRFTNLRNFFQHPSYVIRRVFLSKKAFLKTIYYSYVKKNLPQRDEHQLTPGVFFDKD